MQLILCRDGKAIFDYGEDILKLKDVPLLFSIYHSNKIKQIKGESRCIYFKEIDDVLYISTEIIEKFALIIHTYCIALNRSFPNQPEDILGSASMYFQQLRFYANLECFPVYKNKDMELSLRHGHEFLLATLVFTHQANTFATLKGVYKRQSINFTVSDILVIQMLISRRSEGYRWIPVQFGTQLLHVLVTFENLVYFVHISSRHDKFDSIMEVHHKCSKHFPTVVDSQPIIANHSLYGLYVKGNQALVFLNHKLLQLKYQKTKLRNSDLSFELFAKKMQFEVFQNFTHSCLKLMQSRDRPLEICSITNFFECEKYICSGWNLASHNCRIYLISSEKSEFLESDMYSIIEQASKNKNLLVL
eukprot:NODE_46_length_32145_cov_0.918711.p12 type:complete len:361 gc:universal NODE_46_length_32145_cov_0.918711:11135-10053(-)